MCVYCSSTTGEVGNGNVHIHMYTTLLPHVLKTKDMTVAAAIRNIIIFIITSTCWKNEGKVNAKPIDT